MTLFWIVIALDAFAMALLALAAWVKRKTDRTLAQVVKVQEEVQATLAEVGAERAALWLEQADK